MYYNEKRKTVKAVEKITFFINILFIPAKLDTLLFIKMFRNYKRILYAK